MNAFLLCFKVLVQYGERWKVLVLGDTFPSVVKKEFDIDSEVTILFLALQWKPCEVGKAISFLSFINQNPTLMEKVNLGAGIWHSVGAWGWGIWLWLPSKCQIPLGLPKVRLAFHFVERNNQRLGSAFDAFTVIPWRISLADFHLLSTAKFEKKKIQILTFYRHI